MDEYVNTKHRKVKRLCSGNDDQTVERLLYYREAPHDSYLVFAPRERALFVDQLHRAIKESTTWGEFRKRMPAGEYQRLYEDIFSSDPDVIAEGEDAREPADKEPFTSDCVPGYSDGDYPPWLAQEQDLYLPSELLREFATRADTFINGSFWRLDPKNVALVVERLRVLGYQAERREDLKFW
jgi:hypothetical protein